MKANKTETMSKLNKLINEITEDEWRNLKFQNDMLRTWAEDLNEKNKNKSDFKPFELKEEKILSDKLYKILQLKKIKPSKLWKK